MSKSWIYVEEFSDEVSPAYDLSGWAEWLANTCPDGVDGPNREIRDGEALKMTITDAEYVDAFVNEGEVTFMPDLPEADHYGITWKHGGGWTEDDYYPDRKSLVEGLIERSSDGEDPNFIIGACTERRGEFTATFARTPEGPVLQPDGWAL